MAIVEEVIPTEAFMESATPPRSDTPANHSHDGGSTFTEHDIVPFVLQEPASAGIDGGYGWVVVFICWLLSFWAVGSVYCWGVMQAALIKQGLSRPSTLSWIGSLAFTCIAVLGVLNAKLIQVFGPRRMALWGIMTLAISDFLSGLFTHRLVGLFLTAGLLSGIGTSMCFMVVNVLPAQYFDRKRGLANGIVCAGGGIGGTVISVAMDSMIRHLGPESTFVIFGSLKLATGISAACFIKPRRATWPQSFIEWRLFHNSKFTILFLVGVIATFPLLVPPFFIPLYSASLGLSPSAGAWLVAAFNISSAIGRFVSGFASDHLGPVNILVIVLFLTTISTIVIWPLSNSMGPLVIFAIINGASNGGFFSTMPTVVRTTFGAQIAAVAWAMVVTGWAGGYLLGAPIAGYLLEAYGGPNSTLAAYYPAIFYAGVMALAALILAGIVRLVVSRHILMRV